MIQGIQQCLPTIDRPKAREGIHFFIDLIHKYKVMPAPYSLERSSVKMFMTGKVAMFNSLITETGFFKDIKAFDWDMARFPKGPHGEEPGAAFMVYTSFCILKATKHPKEAWELVKCLTGENLQGRVKSFK